MIKPNTNSSSFFLVLAGLTFVAAGCADAQESEANSEAGGSGGTVAADAGPAGIGGASGTAGKAGAGAPDAAANDAPEASAGQAGAGGGGQGPNLGDPALPGPWPVSTIDAEVDAPVVDSSFSTRCFLPENDPGPWPLVTLAHGFQLPGSQYYASATHLASFGFVVCVPEYEAGMFSPNHRKNAQEIMAVIDWATSSSSPLAGDVDPQKVGAAGHSLGGKVSVIAASMDARISAVLGLDPIDSATNCNPTNCPDASSLLPLPIPTAFLGETTDAQGGFQPCAPATENFMTFYAAASAPSLQVHIDGANHMSFLDDPDACGFVCGFCNTPTRDHAEVIALARAYLAAFFVRHLLGEPSFDDYLTGTIAHQRYVQPGVAAITWK